MLIVLYIASVAIYLVARPRWKFIGPSLLDSYLIGVALFVAGTMFLVFEADYRVDSVRTIGLVAGIFTTSNSGARFSCSRYRADETPIGNSGDGQDLPVLFDPNHVQFLGFLLSGGAVAVLLLIMIATLLAGWRPLLFFRRR